MSNNKLTVKNTAFSNVVKKNRTREVQQWTLRALKEALIPSAGCFGSTTQILQGNPENNSGLNTIYSKDGHTILSHIRFNRAIEDSIQKECTDMTRYIVKEVGDGTTSTVVLSSIIFDELLKLNPDNYPPYYVIKSFKEAVSLIQEEIKQNGRDLTLDDIYDISMICTNNNESVSKTISDIYAEHGLDVFIDVAASITNYDVIKSYDGLTIGVGYSDPAYINTKATKKTDEKAGYSIIRNAHVYAFKDPIDTIEMHNFFNKIVMDNIMTPMRKFLQASTQEARKEAWKKVVPTVIMAPKISIDMNASFTEIIEYMYKFNENMDVKPPLLVITNIGEVNADHYSDIWRLCGCKPIKKYIDPKIQEQEVKDGKAPTMDTVTSFYGLADEIKADAYKSTFINPDGMFAKDENGEYVLDENGDRAYSETYKGQINFLEQELKVAIDDNESIDVIGNLKRRIHSLKANMVDYFVGGINITDRDSVRDLVEDAVKNIRSASEDGVGYGTNFEGLRASRNVINRIRESDEYDDLTIEMVDLINTAYLKMSRILYDTVYYSKSEMGDLDKKDYIKKLIISSLKNDCPMNFMNKEFDHKVLCTIKQDVAILDVIAKIITIMFTTNQSLTQSVSYNMYIDLDED